MEDELDAISRGEMNHLEYLKRFYLGNAHPGLKKQLSNKVSEIDARDVCRIFIGKREGTRRKGGGNLRARGPLRAVPGTGRAGPACPRTSRPMN